MYLYLSMLKNNIEAKWQKQIDKIFDKILKTNLGPSMFGTETNFKFYRVMTLSNI